MLCAKRITTAASYARKNPTVRVWCIVWPVSSFWRKRAAAMGTFLLLLEVPFGNEEQWSHHFLFMALGRAVLLFYHLTRVKTTFTPSLPRSWDSYNYGARADGIFFFFLEILLERENLWNWRVMQGLPGTLSANNLPRVWDSQLQPSMISHIRTLRGASNTPCMNPPHPFPFLLFTPICYLLAIRLPFLTERYLQQDKW